MKKSSVLLLFLLLSGLSLVGCSQKGEKKPEFLVDTLAFHNQNQQVFIVKPGRVSGKQDIVVSSQVAGRVKSLLKKDGDVVSGDQLIVSIDDSIANYGLQVQRARSAVGRASLQSQQTKVSIDKSLTDVSLALDVAKNNYNVTQQTTEQSLKKSELDSSSADAQSQNLQLQFPLEKKGLLNLMDRILGQVDTYLGVTDRYKEYNDDYETFLGAKNLGQKSQVEQKLSELYSLKRQISSLPESSQIYNGVDVLQNGYNKSKEVLDGMKDVLLNSIPSAATFSQGTIDGYKATIDGLLSSLQLAETTFVAYRKQITSLVSQGSNGTLELNKAQAKIAADTTRINTDNALFSTEVGVKNAETNYDSLLKNKNIQIDMARNAIYEANLSYQDALSRYNNLAVKAPIPGVIGNVLVDVGQEVSPGIPLFTLSSKDQQTIEVSVTSEERGYIAKDQFAKILYDGQEFTGSILSIASVADKNFLYKVVVAFDDSVSILGDVASVQLPMSLPYSVLPINIVTPISENKGFVRFYDGTGIQRQSIIIGRVWESYIEVLSGISEGMKIITNDVSYFDPTKFVLKVK